MTILGLSFLVLLIVSYCAGYSIAERKTEKKYTKITDELLKKQ